MDLNYHRRTSELSIRLSWTEVRQFLSVKGSVIISSMQTRIRELLNMPDKSEVQTAPIEGTVSFQDMEHKLLEHAGWTKLHWYEDNAGPGFWSGFPPPDFKETCRKEHQHGAHLPDLLTGKCALYNLHVIWRKLGPSVQSRVSDCLHVCVQGVGDYNRNDDDPKIENASAPVRAIATAWGVGVITEDQAQNLMKRRKEIPEE